MLTGHVLSFSLQHANEDVERMLLGNKCDMEDKRVVPKAKGEQVSWCCLLAMQAFYIPFPLPLQCPAPALFR